MGYSKTSIFSFLFISAVGLMTAFSSFASDSSEALGEDYICCRIADPDNNSSAARSFNKIFYGASNTHQSLSEALKECSDLGGQLRDKKFCRYDDDLDERVKNSKKITQ